MAKKVMLINIMCLLEVPASAASPVDAFLSLWLHHKHCRMQSTKGSQPGSDPGVHQSRGLWSGNGVCFEKSTGQHALPPTQGRPTQYSLVPGL